MKLNEYLRSKFEDDELGHGVRNLLEEDRTETRVEALDDTFFLGDLGETAQETVSETGLGDETDTGSFQRTESNISEEFSNGGGTQVDGSAVFSGLFNTNGINEGLLPEFVTTELEGTLQEVTYWLEDNKDKVLYE
jgi:hypothetical protein